MSDKTEKPEMDKLTVLTYDSYAKEIAEFHSSITPIRLYNLAQTYFLKQGVTLDLGCGIGRDCQWLFSQGFRVYGVDASRGMLDQARKKYSNLPLFLDSLPHLQSVNNGAFSNIFCSAVLMHLHPSDLVPALFTIHRVLRSNGILLVSYRAGQKGQLRETGKLYAPISFYHLVRKWEQFGGRLLYHEKTNDPERNISWVSLVLIKDPILLS